MISGARKASGMVLITWRLVQLSGRNLIDGRSAEDFIEPSPSERDRAQQDNCDAALVIDSAQCVDLQPG
jgi:hypothetical protein